MERDNDVSVSRGVSAPHESQATVAAAHYQSLAPLEIQPFVTPIPIHSRVVDWRVSDRTQS